MKVTSKQIINAFTEWDRRWREEPEKFQSTAEHLLRETPQTYGEGAGAYFEKVLEEQKQPSG